MKGRDCSKIMVQYTRKAEPTVQLRQTDKNSPEKAGFAFFGEFVLAEELGGEARHLRKAEPTVQLRQTGKDLTFLPEPC
jgi:hypothetical protein